MPEATGRTTLALFTVVEVRCTAGLIAWLVL
jgi:hypothetical protein